MPSEGQLAASDAFLLQCSPQTPYRLVVVICGSNIESLADIQLAHPLHVSEWPSLHGNCVCILEKPIQVLVCVLSYNIVKAFSAGRAGSLSAAASKT